MNPSTRTPEGEPNRCPICGKSVVLEPSDPGSDAPCPHCGSLLWFPHAFGLSHLVGFPTYSIASKDPHSKEEVIRFIVDRLAEHDQIPKEACAAITEAMLKRESLGSTAIGRGVAIPHAIYSGINRLVGAIVKVPHGVDFDTPDGKPVHLICLLVAPADRPGDHRRALEKIARRLREE